MSDISFHGLGAFLIFLILLGIFGIWILIALIAVIRQGRKFPGRWTKRPFFGFLIAAGVSVLDVLLFMYIIDSGGNNIKQALDIWAPFIVILQLLLAFGFGIWYRRDILKQHGAM